MIDPVIINIATLLEYNLVVPEYQRPYKWTKKNCNEMFFDIKNALDTNKSAYRLGNIIIHKNDNGVFEIVDGQQRIITLLLLLKKLGKDTINLKVTHDKNTLVNLKANRDLFDSLVLEQFADISEYKERFINYILDKCEVVFIATVLEYQAFQMFDSQNSRGRELDPRDLLKAFHLREISTHISDEEKREIDRQWVNNTDKINALLSRVLYPIKTWSRGESGIEPLKLHIDEFKGISRFDELNKYHNYARPVIYVRNYVEDYNSENMTNISYNVMNKMEYPFQLTGEILNGESFFEMIFHYCDLLDIISSKVRKYDEILINGNKSLQLTYQDGEKTSARVLKKYEQNYCKYVTRLFYNLLLVYVDRFGFEQDNFEIAVTKILKYAVSLRLDYASLREVSYLNYANGESNWRLSFQNINVCRYILNCRNIREFMKFNNCSVDAALLIDEFVDRGKNETRKN
jgi:hypothetical protein